jgi:DnaJ-class molecular chaperone
MVSRSMCHALKIFVLGLGASETEQKVRYHQMARVYHPDMQNGTTGLTSEETADFFKILNNANMFLCGRL